MNGLQNIISIAEFLHSNEEVFDIDFETLAVSQPIGKIPQMEGTLEELNNLTVNDTEI